MAKEIQIVAVKATAELIDLLNGAQLRIGDVIYVPAGAPFGDTPKGVKERAAALAARKSGKRCYVAAPPFLGAALIRPGRAAEPFWLHTALLTGRGPVYKEGTANVLKSERTGALYLGLHELEGIRQIPETVCYEGQELALKVVGFADGFKEPSFLTLWAKGPDGKATFRLNEGDTVPLRPTKAAIFEVVTFAGTPAEKAAATRVAMNCFKQQFPS